MNQINSDQIVDNGIPDNTVKPIPRDLGDIKTSSPGKSGLGFINEGSRNDIPASTTSSSSAIPPTPLPDTPSLIGIKSQVIKIKDDGTYAVDMIIEVEDVRNVSDYEVRISKSAGSI